jgi:hypothetical protein
VQLVLNNARLPAAVAAAYPAPPKPTRHATGTAGPSADGPLGG